MAVAVFGFGLPGLLYSAQNPTVPSVKPLQIPNKFTNLRVLPKNIDRGDLLTRMNQYSGELGVRCSFCHMLNAETGHADFASDAKPEKRAARLMIRMTHTINASFLKQLPAKINTGQVSCYTCHRGHPKPVTKSTVNDPSDL